MVRCRRRSSTFKALCFEQVPGNIRRAEHFLAFLRRFIAYLKKRMEVQQVESETPSSFLGHLQAQVAIDGALRSTTPQSVMRLATQALCIAVYS